MIGSLIGQRQTDLMVIVLWRFCLVWTTFWLHGIMTCGVSDGKETKE